MHRRIVLLIAPALLVATGPAGIAQSTIANPDLSNLASGVLQQTRMARQSIASRDRDSAIGHVKQAIATVNEIQQKDSDGARPLLIPVFSHTETTTTVTPVHRNSDLKHNSSVRGVDGETTTTRLNITAAAERLPAAEAALESGDWNAADGALNAVENSVSVTQTTGDMPLRMARQNLELARTRVLDGKYHDAELPLKSAAQALRDYEMRLSGQQAADVEAAHAAMLDFAARISHEHDGAVGRIDGWLDMLRRLPDVQ
jgi:YfdX protein